MIWVIVAFAAYRRMAGPCFDKQERMDRKDINKGEGLLKESDGIMKIKKGLTLDDLQSAKDQRKIEKSGSVPNVDKMTIKKKQVKELKKLELQSKKSFQHEKVVRHVPAVMLPSLVYENAKVVFLTKSLVQKLLERPESFEEKVKGAYICVGVPTNVVNKKKSYQLAQVAGIIKTSNDGEKTDVKLRALGIPIDISINMLSNAYLTEEECRHLRHQGKVGQREMLPIEELQRKAISLHHDIIDEGISRELRIVRAKIDKAKEKGWRPFQKKSWMTNRKSKALQNQSLIKNVCPPRVYHLYLLKLKGGLQVILLRKLERILGHFSRNTAVDRGPTRKVEERSY